MAEVKKAAIPAWQQTPSSVATDEPAEVTIEHARRFLNDDQVQNSPVEKKAEFLKNKGFDDNQVQKLLAEIEETSPSSSAEPLAYDDDKQKEDDKPEAEPQTEDISIAKEPAPNTNSPSSSPSTPTDAPPIITYPEFLTKSPRPPPLLTPSRLANILTISGSIWTLLYGTARFVISPMVENLNESRSEYYTQVNGRLSELVEKLEGAASEVPYKNGTILKSKIVEEDVESTFSDPAELFSRDVGTQTSPPASSLTSSSASPNNSDQAEKPIDAQARRLAALRSSLRELTDVYTRRAEDTADLTSTLRDVRDEVDALAYPPMPDFTGLSYGRSSEPDDEVKRTKDALRSVKGLFLSSRSFPAAAAAAAAR
ncbi:peroxisomal membrane anchor protein conserved region-domain-containing protein [Xylariomycetidae sp. FL2044]|nr:peroxisomal membrane anchor protein conserved region-domain-containing protein [Xylariomycetidae sp. FL2044]